eukprot:CAMPEP_0197899826 /NCGR_PEP_ID=MMETSP1439-20131203/47492_1 /TAXON_ID=66791 /ORGANISM="Gonyaulax spinifera, Strain CCMP409" /LENGTH=67 /DNA_ID=CAMNT_0043520655 /DNA_START=15 /DNA_END=215 /DNA_ORIENTATION=-
MLRGEPLEGHRRQPRLDDRLRLTKGGAGPVRSAAIKGPRGTERARYSSSVLTSSGLVDVGARSTLKR